MTEEEARKRIFKESLEAVISRVAALGVVAIWGVGFLMGKFL